MIYCDARHVEQRRDLSLEMIPFLQQPLYLFHLTVGQDGHTALFSPLMRVPILRMAISDVLKLSP